MYLLFHFLLQLVNLMFELVHFLILVSDEIFSFKILLTNLISIIFKVVIHNIILSHNRLRDIKFLQILLV